MADLDKGVAISTRGVVDLVMLALPAAAAGLQFLKNERSYEVMALALAFIFLYLYLRLMLSRIEELKAQVGSLIGQINDDRLRHAAEMRDLVAKYEAEIARLNLRYELYSQDANSTTANLFSELSAHAGSRIIGSLRTSKESGAMLYLKPTPSVPPDGVERRGTGVAA